MYHPDHRSLGSSAQTPARGHVPPAPISSPAGTASPFFDPGAAVTGPTSNDHPSPGPSPTASSGAAADVGDRRAGPTPGQYLTLGDVGPGREHEYTPVVTGDGDTVIVLGWSLLDPYQVDVWSERHHAALLPSAIAVTVITDPVRGIDLLRQALAAQTDRLRALRLDRECDAGAHQRILSDIRDFAIDRHLEGTYCREGLNDFLARFGLARYDPRVCVTYTITGSYELDPETIDDDPDAARRDADDHLAPDLSGLGPVIDGSDSYDVYVDSVTAQDR